MTHVRTALRGMGQTLITVGVLLLLFVVYTLYYTGVLAARDQRALNDDLTARWSQVEPAPVEPLPALPGEAFARLYIPSIGVGTGTPLVVVEGVSVADLKKGPGHIPTTQQPGEVGNFVVSGHRTTYGAPFGDVDDIDTGDAIVVETDTQFFTYRKTGSEIVSPQTFEVTLPVPRQPGVAPTKRTITLTTCNPKYSAEQRLIVYGELERVTPKAAGALPPDLAGL